MKLRVAQLRSLLLHDSRVIIPLIQLPKNIEQGLFMNRPYATCLTGNKIDTLNASSA
jgi:hypothetical protein